MRGGAMAMARQIPCTSDETRKGWSTSEPEEVVARAVGGGGLADPCWHGEEQGHGGREAGVVPICLLGGPLLGMVVDPPW